MAPIMAYVSQNCGAAPPETGAFPEDVEAQCENCFRNIAPHRQQKVANR
jgi:hypothetical protein